MSATVGLDQSKAELEAIIASGIFAKAPSLALLLDYVCSKYFEGQANQIKEYNIAVEALGRAPSFDPRQDSIVRVEAFRLRKRLKQYYENEGASRPLRIIIPPGQYVPCFVEIPTQPLNGQALQSIGNLETADVPVTPPSSHELAVLASEPVFTPSEVMQPKAFTGRRWIALLALPMLAVAIAAGWVFRSRAPVKQPAPLKTTSVPIGAESDEVRILCGSSSPRYVDHTGNIWSGDRYFRGGQVFSSPSHPILATADPELFRARREGEFAYDIPLKPGFYELHLYFAETLFGENNTAGGGESSRVFRISINGKIVLPAFDVLADAGGSNTADEKVFKDISPSTDGSLHLAFGALVNGAPFLNGLAILPGIPGKMRPVRIIARPRNYTDQRGVLWGADRYYSRGFAVSRPEAVSGLPDTEIFKAERFGNFVYAIPVSEGRYSVNLKFAETWFGPGQAGGGGAGSRIFDVYCNGVALLRNLDIFRAAGGAQRALEKSFHGIAPNAQGKIVLSFVPVVNYACVNAIEVVDDTN